MTEPVIVSTTTDSEAAARTLATGIVAARLGACAQIVGPIVSVYRWDDAVQTDPEWRIETKTTTARLDALIAHLRAEHTYDVPEIIATPIVGGSPDYLTWLTTETTE